MYCRRWQCLESSSIFTSRLPGRRSTACSTYRQRGLGTEFSASRSWRTHRTTIASTTRTRRSTPTSRFVSKTANSKCSTSMTLRGTSLRRRKTLRPCRTTQRLRTAPASTTPWRNSQTRCWSAWTPPSIERRQNRFRDEGQAEPLHDTFSELEMLAKAG